MSWIFPLSCCLLICFILSITFGILYEQSEVFVVPGTLIRVDRCETNCFTGVGPSGCVYSPYITLSWTYLDVQYEMQNVTFGPNHCTSCCRNLVNSTIAVQIDKENPKVAKDFFSSNSEPIKNSALLVATTVFSFLTFVALVALFCIYANIHRKDYEIQ